MRLCEFSVQGNHLHFVMEAVDARALTRGMQGLAIRMARGLNRLMDRKGSVFADRFHAHLLRTPTEVRRAVVYVVGNRAIHRRREGLLPSTDADPFSSAVHCEVVMPARTYLLTRAGPVVARS